MHKFGWILSLLFILSFSFTVFGCPINSTSLAENMVVLSGVCENEQILLYTEGPDSFNVKSITITGNLTIINSTLVWFFDDGTSKQINVSNSGSFILNNSFINEATGEKVNLTIDSRNSSIVSFNNVSVIDIYDFKFFGTDSLIKLDNLSLDASKSSRFTFLDGSNLTFINSKLRLNYLAFKNYSNVTIDNMVFTTEDYVFNILDSTNISFGFFIKNDKLINLGLVNSSVNLYGVNSKLNVSLDSSSNLSLYDSNCSYRFLDDKSKLFKYHSVDFLTKRAFGASLNLVNFNIYDNLGILYVNGFSDVAGNFFTYLEEFVRNKSSIRYFSNYTINVSKSRYVSQSIDYNVTKKDFVEIELYTSKGIVNYGYSCNKLSNKDFCVDYNPKSSSLCKNMISGDICEVSFIINATDNNLTINSSSLYNRMFSFFVISESDLLNVSSVESSLFNITVVPEYS